jgi:hypothetical protein
MSYYTNAKVKIPTKVCKRCGEEKILHEFAKQKGRDNHRGTCKPCVKKNTKENEYTKIAKYQAGSPGNFGKSY